MRRGVQAISRQIGFRAERLPGAGLRGPWRPYWNPRVRGALFGLTRNTTPAELAHAALEKACATTPFDLWAAMRADWPEAKAANTVLRVDGGMTVSEWTMQRLADLLDAPVDRPMIQEATALGAAYLAGLSAGAYPEPAKIRRQLAAGAEIQAGGERSNEGAEAGGMREGG
jgi:glycerol kinase